MKVSLRFVTLAAAFALSPLLASVQPAAAAAATAKKIADADITVAVERQFMLDAAVPFNLIDVGTHNGIVSLSGQVANLGAKMQAERIAETVKGVRSVVDEITVAPSSLSPEEIQKSVSAALAADPATSDYALMVTADGSGTVTLRGTVHQDRLRAD